MLKKFSQNLFLVLASLSLTLFSLEAALQVASRIYQSKLNEKNHILHSEAINLRLRFADQLRILCLGESTTSGDLSGSYPQVLQKKVDQVFGKDRVWIINAGKSGTDSAEIFQALPELVKKYRPHYALIMMGINDSWNLTTQNWHKRFGHQKILGPTYFFTKIEKLAKYSRLVKFVYLWQINKIFSPQMVQAVQSPQASNFQSFPQNITGNGKLDLEWGEKIFSRYEQERAQRSRPFFLSAIKNGTLQEQLLATRRLLELNFWFAGFDPYKQQKNFYQFIVNHKNDDIYTHLMFATLAAVENKLQESAQVLEFGYSRSLQMPFNSVQEQMQMFLLQRLIVTYKKINHPLKAQYWYDLATKKHPDFSALALVNHVDYFDSAFMRGEINLASLTLNPYSQELTRKYYLAIVRFLNAQNISVLAMQYPNRLITPLKELLHDEKNVQFIDNYQNFKEALAQYKFSQIFTDNFGGDTGHYTDMAHQLITEQVIKTLTPIIRKNISPLSGPFSMQSH